LEESLDFLGPEEKHIFAGGEGKSILGSSGGLIAKSTELTFSLLISSLVVDIALVYVPLKNVIANEGWLIDIV